LLLKTVLEIVVFKTENTEKWLTFINGNLINKGRIFKTFKTSINQTAFSVFFFLKRVVEN